MLGERQKKFLEHWAADWRGADMKVLLSGTTFANSATHHGSYDGRLLADIDSGGWPQTARRRMLHIARSALAFHISGDQHLATLIQHGIQQQRDAIWGFCTPAIAVGYQRWWRPDEVGMPHHNRPEHNLPNTGEYVDGLGNKIFVYAVANPEGTATITGTSRHSQSVGLRTVPVRPDGTHDRRSLLQFLVDVTDPSQQHEYPGWPITLTQRDQDGRDVAGHLPELRIEGVERPVILVHDQATGELVYTACGCGQYRPALGFRRRSSLHRPSGRSRYGHLEDIFRVESRGPLGFFPLPTGPAPVRARFGDYPPVAPHRSCTGGSQVW
jgi:hypothetical protein